MSSLTEDIFTENHPERESECPYYLAGFQHAADLAGVNAESLTGDLEKMLKNIGKADIDGGELADTLGRIGLDAATLSGQRPEKTFESIADALKAIKNPYERANAAQAIFRKSGQALLPLMMSGAEGIRAAAAEAEALGLSFSRVDGAKVEEANDALSRAKSSVSGVFRTIAIGLAGPCKTLVLDGRRRYVVAL